MDFGSQNGVKVGLKSNPTGTSPEKGAHHEYTVKTIEFSMFFGIGEVDSEDKSGEIEAASRLKFKPCFFLTFC